MTYETYCEMTDVLQESINEGSITLEAADELNNIFYESYIDTIKGGISDDKAFISAIKASKKKYVETMKKIKTAVKNTDLDGARKELEAGKSALKELRQKIESMPSTIANTSIPLIGNILISALTSVLTFKYVEKSTGAEISNSMKALYAGIITSFAALKEAMNVAKNSKDGNANVFKRAALKSIDKNIEILDKIKFHLSYTKK